jgi:hypothetical protein
MFRFANQPQGGLDLTVALPCRFNGVSAADVVGRQMKTALPV